MRVRKITGIKKYKSFSDFSWCNFCKNGSGQEEILQKFSVIFGENGAGKSSVCDILKSVSENYTFQNVYPENATVEIADNEEKIGTYKYENRNWSGIVNKNSFLFFDVDFVNSNVHTHGIRSSNLQQGAHTQRAGKLIIDLDKQANNLKEEVEIRKNELITLQNTYSDILKKQFTTKDQELFKIYNNASEESKKQKLDELQEKSKKIEADLLTLQKLNKKYAEISCLTLVREVEFSNLLSPKETYSELFSRQIKEKTQNEADTNIKTHFEKHKRFIEFAKDQIPQNYEEENCPLCMQPLKSASAVIEYYRAVFDKTYENTKHKFLTDIQSIKNELILAKSNLALLPRKVMIVFDTLEKVKNDFGIQDIYKIDEKIDHTKNFNNLSVAEIDELLTSLEALKSIDRNQVDIADNYDAIVGRLGETEKLIENLNKLIKTKNEDIENFKSKYSDQTKITSEIQKENQNYSELNEIIDFLNSSKCKFIKNQNEIIAKQEELSKQLKTAQESLKNYLANTIPEGVIVQMIKTLEKFNLSFNLEHVKPSPNTKDYSFSFKIKDKEGNEREFKDGLSEGERQLISIAFFFAINENLPGKEKAVLIFDDPITSLDSPNLKILAELIHKKNQEFEQVIVLTHHPLFFKYLRKCENPSACKFGVLKNHEAFGGSFIFFDPGFDLNEELQRCNEEIKQNAQKGVLKPEEISLKYGQLLRLSIEKFIKHDLLMWDKENNFEKEIVANLSKSKNKIQKLDENDLEVMINIHKYCNHSNLLHVDKENPSALSELIIHIDKFIKIIDKTKL